MTEGVALDSELEGIVVGRLVVGHTEGTALLRKKEGVSEGAEEEDEEVGAYVLP